MHRLKSVLMAVAVLVASCGGDTTFISDVPVELSTVPSVEEAAVGTAPADTLTLSETGSLSGSCPEGTNDYDGVCQPDDSPAETSPVDTTIPAPAEETLAADETPADTTVPLTPETPDPGEAIAGILPEPEPVEPEAPTWVFAEFWRFGLTEDALELVNPRQVNADKWLKKTERKSWGLKAFYVFYRFNNPEGDPKTEADVLDGALNIARATLEQSNTIYHPVRYDVSWEQHPDTVIVNAYFPMGEKRFVTVRWDGTLWKAERTIYTPGDSTDAGVGGAIPPGPPIKHTVPFTEPRWADTAEVLGRDCPPVEAIWSGNGNLVTDQCTLDAIDTAMRFAWREPSELRQRAIRDGHVLTDLFHRIDNQHEINPYHDAVFGQEARASITTEIRNIKWAGNWPGASMIHLEYRNVHPDREMTEDEWAGAERYFTGLAARGENIGPKYERGEYTLGFAWWWESALIVRTADGTWRMSYRSFCRFYQIIWVVDQSPFLCPDDPTPEFPDSDLYDKNLQPPTHPRYYTDSRQSVPTNPIHDGGTPRDNTTYIGVPPS